MRPGVTGESWRSRAPWGGCGPGRYIEASESGNLRRLSGRGTIAGGVQAWGEDAWVHPPSVSPELRQGHGLSVVARTKIAVRPRANFYPTVVNESTEVAGHPGPGVSVTLPYLPHFYQPKAQVVF